MKLASEELLIKKMDQGKKKDEKRDELSKKIEKLSSDFVKNVMKDVIKTLEKEERERMAQEKESKK